MEWHLVGGFLGSGKTTTITHAAKMLIQRGLRVGIVTNDQGAALVDSAFVQSLHLPTVEVTGGCFCCNYDDLENQLRNLRDNVAPDVIFAESVGSCADLVSTVIKPYQQLSELNITLNSFSVLTDIRLLRRYLNNQPLPFSDNVIYIFEKQIEEANLLVINKRDLVEDDVADNILLMATERFPDKTTLLHSSADDHDIERWLQNIRVTDGVRYTETLDIDYERYADGESRLAWLNETITFSVEFSNGKLVVEHFLKALIDHLKKFPIGHLKVFVADDKQQAKLSLSADMPDDWDTQIPQFTGKQITCVINARIELSITDLVHHIELSLRVVQQELPDVMYTRRDHQGFHPSPPVPTHRIP